MGLIDTHTHLETFARHGTLDPTLARAREAGLEAMITIGTSDEDWALYRDLAAAHAADGFVRYSVGLHPCSVDEHWEAQVAQIEAFWTVAQASSLRRASRGLSTSSSVHTSRGTTTS